jgi:uracil-DNA glycosylase
MTFNEDQQRAWALLDIGPLYITHDEAGELVADTIETPIPPRALAAKPSDIVPTQERIAALVPTVKAKIAEQARQKNDASKPHDLVKISSTWDGLRTQVAECQACSLCESRKRTVFSGGTLGARVLIIGEAPGEEEDRTGEPFVGQAGLLLTQMLKAIGLERETDTLILNSLKCRPPANRNPAPEELAACRPYLIQQIELARPKVILLTGKFASLAVLGLEQPIATLREHAHQFRFADGTEIPVLVSYHPAYYLRRLTEKAKGWVDLLKLRAVLAEPAPPG